MDLENFLSPYGKGAYLQNYAHGTSEFSVVFKESA